MLLVSEATGQATVFRSGHALTCLQTTGWAAKDWDATGWQCMARPVARY